MQENSQPTEPEQSSWQFNGPRSEYASDYTDNAAAITPMTEPIEWTASEYISHDKPPAWYAAFFGISVTVIIGTYFLTRDWLPTVVIFLSSVTMGVYANRKPGTRTYRLDDHGLTINGRLFSYGSFKSYSVIEEGAINSIWLKPIKKFTPMAVMYFSPEDENKIVSVLSAFLPHEKRELDAFDRFSKQIKF